MIEESDEPELISANDVSIKQLMELHHSIGIHSKPRRKRRKETNRIATSGDDDELDVSVLEAVESQQDADDEENDDNSDIDNEDNSSSKNEETGKTKAGFKINKRSTNSKKL